MVTSMLCVRRVLIHRGSVAARNAASAVVSSRQPRGVPVRFLSMAEATDPQPPVAGGTQMAGDRPEKSQPIRKLPTKHSRKLPPPACTDPVQLADLTAEILESKRGSLFAYEHQPGVPDNSEYAWGRADVGVQKVEWLVRGHSALVPNTLLNNDFSPGVSDVAAEDRVDSIEKLIDRVNDEGEMYMKLRKKLRTQMIVVDGPEEDDGDESRNVKTIVPVKFACPGPTTHMFDVLLDTMCECTDFETPDRVGNILKHVMERYELDGGQDSNANRFTRPTAQTFNAALRAIANTPNESEMTRDEALAQAFFAFDNIGSSPVRRNTATYAYIIRVVDQFLPKSTARDEVVGGLWLLAQQERVVDEQILDAMKSLEFAHPPELSRLLEGQRENTGKFAVRNRHRVDDVTY